MKMGLRCIIIFNFFTLFIYPSILFYQKMVLFFVQIDLPYLYQCLALTLDYFGGLYGTFGAIPIKVFNLTIDCFTKKSFDISVDFSRQFRFYINLNKRLANNMRFGTARSVTGSIYTNDNPCISTNRFTSNMN